MSWNISAECVSTVMLCIIWIYSRQSHSLLTLKNKLFQICFFVTFVAMVTNILSTVFIQYMNIVPLWINRLITSIYFVFTPLMGVVYFYYALSILYEDEGKLPKFSFFLSIPALLYFIMALLNPFHHLLFYLDKGIGYVRGEYIIITYMIFYIYGLAVCILVVLVGKRVEFIIRNILLAFPVIAVLVVVIQQFYPDILLSGSAATCALLIIYLYLQNKRISIDYLLDIPNRQEFLSILQHHMNCPRPQPFIIIVISLREFKQINDTYGQHMGDEFLKSIGAYLGTLVKRSQLYRFGGDEFAILTPETDVEKLKSLILTIEKRFTQPWKFRNFNCLIRSAMGIVHYPLSTDNYEDMINALEFAISTAKRGKDGSVCYCSPEMLDDVKRRHKVIDILKEAVAHDNFEVYYQPIWSISSKKFNLAESLLRLPNTPLGPIYPDEFIPLAEETGLIIDITYQVLDKVCHFLHDLTATGTDIESITVNFSGVQFSQLDIADRVFSIIEANQLPYHKIKIEITESVMADNMEIMDDFLAKMHEKGIQIGLDDFGTGYCNLISVMNMPFDVLKIDKSILWSAMVNEKAAILMLSIASAVHKMNIRIVAEGVENKEQEAFVKECCCDWIQGFLYAKPMPREEAEKYFLKMQ